MAKYLKLALPLAAVGLIAVAAFGQSLPPDATYRPLPTLPLDAVKALDEAQKSQVMQRQQALFEQRYNLGNRPLANVLMSGGKKPVQGGVRVELPAGVAWDRLSAMSPDEIRQQGFLPAGFIPLPHVKQATGGQVFPNQQIDEINRQERRNIRRNDIDFDFPDHFTPEFPPPIFLTSHPELGDISRGDDRALRRRRRATDRNADDRI